MNCLVYYWLAGNVKSRVILHVDKTFVVLGKPVFYSRVFGCWILYYRFAPWVYNP